MRLGKHTFTAPEPLVMAVVNRTRDSFYDQGATFRRAAALERVDRVVAEGAAIVDVGGVKAGKGELVDVAEEIRRVVSFVAEVRERHPSVAISVDTWRAPVAREACQAGASLLNDTWGGADPELAEVAAEYGVGLVCAHPGPQSPRTDPYRVHYPDVVADVVARVTGLAERAVSLGVPPESVLIDPAHDFGKNTRHSLEITRRLDELVATGWPVLVALSNKDFVGETLNLPTDQRLFGTLGATAVAAWHGARVFRAHQVAETLQVLRMVASIRGERPPAVSRRGLA